MKIEQKNQDFMLKGNNFVSLSLSCFYDLLVSREKYT